MIPRTRASTLLLTAGFALAAGAVVTAACAAGGLSVSPVSLEFDRMGAVRAMEVSNPGNGPADVQIRLFAWTAEGGEDRTGPSADIGFSPPMFHLQPGARQVVRFAATAAPGGQERAYRLYVEQLPTAGETGLQMPVRMILPLFIEPAGTVSGHAHLVGPKVLRWQATYDTARRRVRLIAENPSDRRLRLLNLAYDQGGGAKIVAPGLSGYVLAGKGHAWDFDYAGQPGATLTIRAGSDQGDFVAQVPLAVDGRLAQAPAIQTPPPGG